MAQTRPIQRTIDALAALRAEPVSEPIGEIVERTEHHAISGADMGIGCTDGYINYKLKSAELYATALEKLPVGTKIYTAPQSAVPLTDERVAEIVGACTTDDNGYDIWCHGTLVARMVEAAHGIGEQQ